MSLRTYTGVLLLAVCLTLAVAGESGAQESATIQATATVVTTLSISGTHDLEFQVVTPSVNKTVDKSDAATAGAWLISGAASSNVTLTFALPTDLTHATLPANTMPLSFSTIDAAYDNRQAALVDQSNPVASFDPAAGASLSLSIEGQLRIFLGASVSPGAAQEGGDYAADITLTVASAGG